MTMHTGLDKLRQKLQTALQSFVDFISEGDDFSHLKPDAFLLMGNPDARSFFCFAEQWRERKENTPICLTGGRGRGTLPLIHNIIHQLEEQKLHLSRDEKLFLQTALHDQTLYETDLLNFILNLMQIPSSTIFTEERPSKNTKENFINSQRVLQDYFDNNFIQKPIVACITNPPLLLRAQATAKQFWRSDWIPLRWKTYSVDVSTFADNSLIAFCGYILGYPDVFKQHYSKLNFSNELIGYQSNGGIVTDKAFSKLENAKGAFELFLNAIQLSYDENSNNLIRSEKAK